MLSSLGFDNLSWQQVMEMDGLVAVEIYVMTPGSNLLGHLHLVFDCHLSGDFSKFN